MGSDKQAAQFPEILSRRGRCEIKDALRIGNNVTGAPALSCTRSKNSSETSLKLCTSGANS